MGSILLAPQLLYVYVCGPFRNSSSTTSPANNNVVSREVCSCLRTYNRTLYFMFSMSSVMDTRAWMWLSFPSAVPVYCIQLTSGCMWRYGACIAEALPNGEGRRRRLHIHDHWIAACRETLGMLWIDTGFGIRGKLNIA